MLLSYFKEKYNLNSYLIKKLVEEGKLSKVTKCKYKIEDEQFFADFDIEKYKQKLHDEHMRKVGEARKAYLSIPENRAELSLIVQTQWENPEVRRKHSESNKAFWENASKDFLERHAKNVSKGTKEWYEKNCRNETYLTNLRKAMNRPETKQAIYEGKMRNSSYSTSETAECCKTWLRQLGLTIEEEKAYPDEPSLHCDVYIKEHDLWIEFHFCPFHNKCSYDKSNEQHKQKVAELESIKTAFSKSILQHWTYYDVLRKASAERNKLNWKAFYDPKDFDNYMYSLGYKDTEV